MKSFVLAALVVCLVAPPVGAQDPLKGANYGRPISGPVLEPGALEGKVVFLEYFGYR